MKIKGTKVLKDGRRNVLIELGPNEDIPVHQVHVDAYYRLGYPHDDEILPGYCIKNPQKVCWDSIAQTWVDA
jgi:hypothetical protein